MPREQRSARDSGAGDHPGPDELAGPLPSGPAARPPSAGESPREAVHRRMRELAEAHEHDEGQPENGDAAGNGGNGNGDDAGGHSRPPDQDAPA